MQINIGKYGEVKAILAFKEDEHIEEGKKLYNFIREKELFNGGCGEIYSHLCPQGDKFIIVGLGEKNKLNLDSLRKASFKLGRKLMKLKVESVGLTVPDFQDLSYDKVVQAISEGLLQSEYSFEKYLTEKKTISTVKNVYLDVLNGEEENAKKAIEEAQIIMDGVFLARNLVNEPAMYMTPETLAANAKKELVGLGVEVEIYDKKAIEELGMEAFLAVSKGSEKEPQFIKMTWNGNPNDEKKLALVGKGITYDSGGYSIKTNKGMVTMKADMAGSAAVIGVMKSIAMSNLNKNVVGIVAACENMLSGGAYKPGDIIGSMSSKTIEVLNTDAEGRLTLADALWYATEVEKADKIIDLATLTGACVVALGDVNTGAITNDKNLMETVKEAAELAGEPVWQLPSNDEYRDLIKGDFADLKNSVSGGAGTITAGLFLEEFVNNIPWVHLDIAGTAFISKGRNYLPKGATGIPVKTLYNLVKSE
ncbi:MAG TPA: leucyl aminopeptidase [Tissierellales bacterium]|nr:leucyl aminopeptidase [Tissierellales bacterium]